MKLTEQKLKNIIIEVITENLEQKRKSDVYIERR